MTGKGQSCFLTVRRPFPVYPDKQTIIRVHRHVSKVPIAVIDFQSTCVSFYRFVSLDSSVRATMRPSALAALPSIMDRTAYRQNRRADF